MTFDTESHPRGHATNAGAFSEKTQGTPETSLLRRVSVGESMLNDARQAMADAALLRGVAAKTVVTELISARYPKAATVEVAFDEENGDDGYSYLARIVDAEGTELWDYTQVDDGERYTGDITGANDLLDEIGFYGTLNLNEYRESTVPLLVLRIKLASDEEKDRLVDEATDEERQEMATDPSAEIRLFVARSPETDIDTLDLLRGDADPDVAAAAVHSLG